MTIFKSNRMQRARFSSTVTAALLAVLSISSAVFAQQPAPAPATKDTDLAQIREQLRVIESRLQALERRLPAEVASAPSRAEAERKLLDARGAYREAYGKARADYRNKMAECENLEGKGKVTCAQEAKAARDKAIDNAEAARRRAEDEAYALAPGLETPYMD
jgi:hypothetical protein